MVMTHDGDDDNDDAMTTRGSRRRAEGDCEMMKLFEGARPHK